jgi:FkbM family methyltransferase
MLHRAYNRSGDRTADTQMKSVENADTLINQYKALRPRAKIEIDGVTLTYVTPNGATKWRVDTLFHKEPDTIAWIRAFQPNDIFVDIGANVGMYSIFAAKTRSVRTYALEPESQNYALLNENIVQNLLNERVTAYCLALSDELGFSQLHLYSFLLGGSGHTYGEQLDHNLLPRKPAYSQGCVSATLDMLIDHGAIPVPTHIKIDVDGLEHKVIAGCKTTLENPLLRSLLVEINTNLEPHNNLVDYLTGLGFAYDSKQADRARRTEGESKGTGNYVFYR